MPIMPKVVRAHWLPPKREAWEHPNRWEGYKTNAWKKFSWHFKLANPICATPGCGQPTYYTDHINPDDKLTDALNPAKCQPLCRKCGDKKTNQESQATKAKGKTNV